MSKANEESFWNKIMRTVVIPLIIAAVIGAVAHWRTHIFSAFESGWFWFTESVIISRFWLILLGLCSLSVLILFRRYFVSHPTPHHEYCQDDFDNLRWNWNWASGHPSNLLPYCPDCERIMHSRRYRSDEESVRYECQSCKHPVILK